MDNPSATRHDQLAGALSRPAFKPAAVRNVGRTNALMHDACGRLAHETPHAYA
jgi:hypothetical protein